MKKDLSNQVTATYKTLRLGLAVLAFAFPLILYGGGRLFWRLPLAGSLSAYYHYHCVEITPEKGTPDQSDAPTCTRDTDEPGKGVLRNPFVGILFAVGALLFAYQGFSRLEDYALNLAGILAWGVALFPLNWPPEPNPGFSFTLHGALAVSFFVCIAYVCIFRAGDTLPLIHDAAIRKRYLRTYQLLGWAMVIFPLLAWALTSLTPFRTSMIFFVELAGIYVFSTYWVIKSHEASRTNVDKKASHGKLRVRPHGFSDALRQLPVTPVDNPTQQEENTAR